MEELAADKRGFSRIRKMDFDLCLSVFIRGSVCSEE